MLIAYLEDDPHQGELVKAWLEDSDCEVDLFATAKAFVNGFLHRDYDLALLDWELPDVEGLGVLKWIRNSQQSKVPVLFLTGRDANRDLVEALDSGADDYLTKPFERTVLVARTRALARRAAGHPDHWLVRNGPYEFDRRSETATVDGKPVKLTRREFQMAVALLENLSTVVTRERIMFEVWGLSTAVETRTVDTHASRLRKKMGWVPDNGWELRSVYQKGYRLQKLQHGNS
ncbi:MAG: response regulator transcription factor [Pseudomonadota bacterium]